MESIAAAAWEGLVLVFSWPNILYPVIGTMLAMLFAVVPGISGVTLMALAIPLTFAWEPVPVLLLFGAFVGGGTFMGSVTAILFNIPGTSANAATMLDGHPMARQGRARTAIGASASASAIGSTLGVLVLVALIPVMQRLLLAFGPPELLMVAVWGLTTLAAFTGGAPHRGLAMAGLGLLLSFVGMDPRTAEPRYTLGTLYLRDGVSLVAVFLGVFALAQIVDLIVSGRQTISGRTRPEELSGNATEGILSTFRHFGLVFRSSVIGTVVGLIPGVGATVASFVAYGQAARGSSGESGRFGRGDIRGVLAPEASNDAKDGAALVPTLAFGIPGGAGTALLLAALTVHGVETGKTMLGENLALVFVLIWSLFLSNWITSVLGLAVVHPLARLTTLRVSLLAPVLLGLVMVGACAYRGRFADVWLALAFGLLGFALRRNGWPVIPLVIGLVLGRLFEDNLLLTLRLQELGRVDFWTRPIVVVLLGLTVAGLAAPVIWRSKPVRPEVDNPRGGRVERRVLALLLLVAATAILLITLDLGRVARLAAEKVAVATVILLLLETVLAFLRPATGVSGPGAVKEQWSGFLWILLLPLLVGLLGFAVGVPLFSALFLRIRSAESWLVTVLTAVAMWGLIYGLFDLLLGMPLHSGWTGG